MRRGIHRHDHWVVVAGPQSRTDLLNVVEALGRAASAGSVHLLIVVAARLLDRLRLIYESIVGRATNGEARSIITGRPPTFKFLIHFHKYCLTCPRIMMSSLSVESLI